VLLRHGRSSSASRRSVLHWSTADVTLRLMPHMRKGAADCDR
jgi:hypothetical protein